MKPTNNNSLMSVLNRNTFRMDASASILIMNKDNVIQITTLQYPFPEIIKCISSTKR